MPGFDRWWLLPFGIVAASTVIALGIVVLGPSFAGRSSAEVVPRAASESARAETTVANADCSDAPANSSACQGEHHYEEELAEGSEVANPTETAANVDCSAASSNDYLCIQRRYQDIVRDFGVQAAFAELRGEMASSEFVSSNCHQMTHVIGRAAADIYGDIPSTYSLGDSFCGSGYYHGALETIVAKIGPDRILEEADTLCTDLGRQGRHSLFHYNCAHGLGHGFMGIQENELFDSLETCDALTDPWERERCYGGVFMENVVTKDDPEHPSKYLKADQPLYPCNVVGTRYKNECYQRQTSYALQTQGNNFSKVFDLCRTVEDDFQLSCYQGLGWDASVQSLKQGGSEAVVNESTSMLCNLGGDQEVRSNCVVGAVEYFIRHYYNDAQAKAFCEYFGADLRAMCLQEAEEYYKSLQSPPERRGTSS